MKVATAAAEAGIDGLTFYRGIPGGIGGALYMNAGCYGTETRDRMVELRAVTRAGRDRHAHQCRHGLPLPQVERSARRRVRLGVYQGFPGDSRRHPRRGCARSPRSARARQPTRAKTGGSTFKNPEGNSSWKLIDEAGGRGLTFGGAQMSELHANFLLNLGEADAFEVETLGETVRNKVRAKHGIELKWEIRRMGHFVPGREVREFLDGDVVHGSGVT